jgi:hypothetical protein
MWEWNRGLTCSWIQHWIEAIFQLHVRATLTADMARPYQLDMSLGETHIHLDAVEYSKSLYPEENPTQIVQSLAVLATSR